MPRLKEKPKDLTIKNISAEISAEMERKGWDNKHLADLLSWYGCSQKYQKLCRVFRNIENARLSDILDILMKLGLKIEVKKE